MDNLKKRFSFDESVDIKFKSTFNMTNPKKNPREKVEYLKVRNLISFLKPNLNFLYFSALKQCAIFKDIIILFVML